MKAYYYENNSGGIYFVAEQDDQPFFVYHTDQVDPGQLMGEARDLMTASDPQEEVIGWEGLYPGDEGFEGIIKDAEKISLVAELNLDEGYRLTLYPADMGLNAAIGFDTNKD